MRFRPAGLAGSWLIDLDRFEDERGFFARIWDEAIFAEHGMPVRNLQTNVSYNVHRGTTRGLHWQVPPYGESKFLRCTRGSVFDVAVDLRPDSPTFRQWQGHVIDSDSHVMVYVPEYCAHGYQALEDGAEVSYQVSHPYVPGSERGLRWDDPTLRIEWPITEGVVMSDKDRSWPDLETAVRS